jgi:hypothetical protein
MGLSTFMFGQTYLSEDFSGTMPPADWTIDGLPAQWSISNSANAGGTAPEAMFTWIQQTSVTHLISPEIDLTGLTSVNLTFRHFYDDFSGAGPLAGVATRSGGGSWNSIWEINPGSNVGPQELTFEIDNGDVGASDFQIAFYLNGNMYNIDYWYIDDVWLYLPLNVDASMSAITTPGYVNGPTEVMGTVKNLGSDQITSLEISWQIDEGDVYTTSFTGLSINFGATYDFTCEDMFELPIGGYDLKVWIVNVNGSPDQDPTNDMLMKPVSVVSYTVPKTPCFEEFTSSTCPPCATFNAQFVPWCEQHADEITLIKYQMNWPGSGDPYYTAEGGVRRNWYGVTWVPWLVGEGAFVNTNIGAVQAKFDEAMAQPGLLDIASTHSLDGTVMSITTNILPFADFTNFKVVINVFEWLTTENATTNGETEFENVMMKMVPDANGTNTDLMDRMPFTIEETVDLNGTFVEEWEDLGVMVIVQDNADKVVFQSAYSLEDMEYATDATLSMLTYDGMEVPGFSPDVFEYTIVLPMGTIEVPAVAAMLNDENGIAIVIPTQELPGATTVDVFAEDRATKNTYTINFEVNTTGIEPEVTKAVSVYPNPTNGKVFISGAENATVEIYNLTGAQVASYTDFSSNVIDLSAMEEGIYFLNIVIDNKTVLNKKISLLK